MTRRLSKAEQDDIVGQLAVEVETLTWEEFEELYDQLDIEHKMEADENLREFVDNAVGSEHWDSDEG